MVDQITFASGASMLSVSASSQSAATRSASAPVTVAQASPQARTLESDSGSHDAAIAVVNQHLEQSQSDLRLTVDRGSGRPVVQVVQQGTGQVLFQVPSAEVLGMSRRVREMQSQALDSGALVDKQG